MKETSIPLQSNLKDSSSVLSRKEFLAVRSSQRSLGRVQWRTMKVMLWRVRARERKRVNGRPSQHRAQSQLQHRPDALPRSPPWRNVPSNNATRAERPPCGVSEKASRTEGMIAASSSVGGEREQSESHVGGAQGCKNRCNSAHDLSPTGHLPAGMENEGNMCYANSSIQLLFYCKWCALRS